MDRPKYLKLFEPVEKDGRTVHEPKRPALVKLAEKFGSPPWRLHCPDYGLIPEESTDLVEEIEWRGVVFRRSE